MNKVDNYGIGTLYATFSIHKTNGVPYLTEDNIGDAVCLSGDNEISLEGLDIIGRLEHVCDNLSTVRIRGIIRFRCISARLNMGVISDGHGKVMDSPKGRGIVIAVYDGCCDVLL